VNKISSRTDWLLDSCYSHCFLCGISLSPPLLHKDGTLQGVALCFDVVVDEYGDKADNEEGYVILVGKVIYLNLAVRLN
jgi:hypothetical protein